LSAIYYAGEDGSAFESVEEILKNYQLIRGGLTLQIKANEQY